MKLNQIAGNIVQNYTSGSNVYILDGTGSILLTMTTSSLEKQIVTVDMTVASASYANSANFATLANSANTSSFSYYANTSSVSQTASYVKFGAIYANIKTVGTSTYSVGSTDHTILCSFGGTSSVTLPNATGSFGQVVNIVNISQQTASMTNVSAQGGLISNISTLPLMPFGAINVHASGSNWWIIGGY